MKPGRYRRHRRFVAAVALAFAACATLGALALAAFQPVDQQFRISVSGNDGNGTINATHSKLAFNPERNEYLAVWSSDALSNNQFEVYGQRLSVAGTNLGPQLQISHTTDAGSNRDAGEMSAVYNPQSNRYLVVWWGDGMLINDEFEILGQFISDTGAPVGASFRISNALDVGSNRDADRPELAYNATANQYLVVWRADESAADDEFEIWGQRLNASGIDQGSDFQISTVGTDGDPAREGGDGHVAYNSVANEYLVAWVGDHVADDKFEVFGHRVSAAGVEQGSDFRISNTGADTDQFSDAFDVDLAFDPVTNQYLAVFEADRTAGASEDPTTNEVEIFGQRISSTGTEIGSDFRISTTGPTDSGIHDAAEPSVAYGGPADEFLVSWQADHVTDEEFEVHGQRLAGDGTDIGADFRISRTGADGDASRAALSPDVTRATTAGQYLAVWDATMRAGGEFEIFGRRLGNNARCAGKDATRLGTSQADAITGGSGAEVFAMLGGADSGNGGGGNDTMCGGGGNDRLNGGGANDLVQGDSGNDTLRGGPANDRLVGGAGGQDKCIGGPGADSFAASCETITQ